MENFWKRLFGWICGFLVILFLASTLVGIEKGIGPFEVWSDIISKAEIPDPFKKIKEEAYQKGFNDGRKEGIEAGKESGFEDGFEAGYTEGLADGEAEKLEAMAELRRELDEKYRERFEGQQFFYESIGGGNYGFENIYDSDTATERGPSSNSNGSGSSGNGGGPGGFTDYGDAEVICDYVLNKNTMKFHESWCASVSNVKPNNREYFSGLRSDVISRGFEPCARCNP